MFHPSIWHPIDMTAAFRSMRPNTSPEKNPVSSFNASFSVNTLLNQSSSDPIRLPSTHPHHLFTNLFQHYPYSTAFRPADPSSSAFLPTGKRFKSNSHDENDDKHSVCRSSTIDLQNPHCPICQIALNGQDMITHVQHELETLQKENKILRDNNNIDQTFKTRYETFLRVRTSRQQRLNAKLQLHHRRSIRNDTRNCPICYQLIPMNSDEEYFFTHIQQCSRKREQFAAVAAIANHHRLQPIATVDDPDVNVVDVDDGSEREEKSTSCQESFNSDQRYSPSIQTDISYVPELDPPKCVACMDL